MIQIIQITLILTMIIKKRPDLVSMGTGLGQWSNELDADKGEFITEFVATSPKSYAYKTGLTLDVTSAKYTTLNRIKKLINEQVKELETAERHRFQCNKTDAYGTINKKYMTR